MPDSSFFPASTASIDKEKEAAKATPIDKEKEAAKAEKQTKASADQQQATRAALSTVFTAEQATALADVFASKEK